MEVIPIIAIILSLVLLVAALQVNPTKKIETLEVNSKRLGKYNMDEIALLSWDEVERLSEDSGYRMPLKHDAIEYSLKHELPEDTWIAYTGKRRNSWISGAGKYRGRDRREIVLDLTEEGPSKLNAVIYLKTD
jgi:hypothetical protein